MFFEENFLNIEKGDICYSCKRVKSLDCPLLVILSYIEVTELDSFLFSYKCPLYTDKRGLKLVKGAKNET